MGSELPVLQARDLVVKDKVSSDPYCVLQLRRKNKKYGSFKAKTTVIKQACASIYVTIEQNVNPVWCEQFCM